MPVCWFDGGLVENSVGCPVDEARLSVPLPSRQVHEGVVAVQVLDDSYPIHTLFVSELSVLVRHTCESTFQHSHYYEASESPSGHLLLPCLLQVVLLPDIRWADSMKIRTTVVCLPVRNLDKTSAFYKDALGFSDIQVEEGIITLELPNLSLFLMEKNAFETYSRKAGRGAQFPNDNVGMVVSCAMVSKEEVDTVLENVPKHGGTVRNKAAMDETSGGYTGYFADPDGYLWELVHPQQQ